MKRKERFWEDETRNILRGRFYSLAEPGEVVPVYNLCGLEDFYFKSTKRGKIKRGRAEMNNLQETLYNAKLIEKEAGVKKKKSKVYGGLNEADNHTVSESIERFRQEYLPTKSRSTQRGYNFHLDYWDEKFGSKKLSNLDEDDIQIARDELLSPERSNGTVNRYLAAFSSVITVCIEDFKWCRKYELRGGKKTKVGNMANPCLAIKQKPEPESRVRFLLPEECKKLLTACSGELRDAVMLSLLTGARKREIWDLRFDAVNFEKKVLSFWNTKSGKPRSVPIYGDAFDILKRRFKSIGTNSWVFPRKDNVGFLDKPKDFGDYWYKALKKSGVKDFHYHDLRHTAASYMVMSGVTLSAVCEILGHSDIKMTFRYAHLAPSHLQGAMELLGEEIMRITT